MALLLTLLVAVVLTVVVLEFNYLMRVHATLSNNIVEDLRAEAAARSGVEMAKALLLNDMLADAKDGLAMDSMEDEWAAEIELEDASAKTKASISDEQGKLNLNRLIKKTRAESDIETEDTRMVETVRRLFSLLEIDPDLVDSVIDWIDEDDEEKAFGAESSHYESLDAPLTCKNGYLDSIDELILIEGFDAEILYGKEDKPGLKEFVTVHGDEKGLVNVNTASEQVIAAILNSESLAADIISMRESNPFEGVADLVARVPQAKLSDLFTTSSSFFMVSSTGRVLSGEGTVRKVSITARLRRVERDEEELGLEEEEGYFSIDTAFWKVER